MAGLCRASDSVWVCILFFLTIWTVFSFEEQNFYNIDYTDSQLIQIKNIKLQDKIQHVQKRQAPQINTTNVSSNQTVPRYEINHSRTVGPDHNTEDLNKNQNMDRPSSTTSSKDLLSKNLDESNMGFQKSTTVPLILMKNNVESPTIVDNNALMKAKDSEEDDGMDEILTYGKVDVTDEAFNKTLKQHNVSDYIEDSHTYYNSTTIIGSMAGQKYWTDFSKAITNDMLSNSHRRAATIKLSFNFPFYGHLIRNVTIATGGFIYTGDFVHSWLAATQYVAPLMANFDTSLSNESCIKHIDNNTSFTVQWENVSLQDRPSDGQFTFQATLHKNGDIVFVYRDVPLAIKKMQEKLHPVKIGLSDAYIMDNSETTVRRKTIYEYHRINFPKEKISNWTVIYLKALPTCLHSKDCHSCLNTAPNLKCYWCSSLNKCSNGVDRFHQDWRTKGCDIKKIAVEANCDHQTISNDRFEDADYSYASSGQHASKESTIFNSEVLSPNITPMESKASMKVGLSRVFAVLFLMALVVGFGMWVVYAYRNPHTTSGQMLIRYRPSQWRWRRGEARYTAATIHM